MSAPRGVNCCVIGCNNRRMNKGDGVGVGVSESGHSCTNDDVDEQNKIKRLYPRTFHR